jgi:hypothetical protein
MKRKTKVKLRFERSVGGAMHKRSIGAREKKLRKDIDFYVRKNSLLRAESDLIADRVDRGHPPSAARHALQEVEHFP